MSDATNERGRRDERELRAQYEAIADASCVLHQYGAWFVTEYGVEGLNQGGIHHIAAEQLWGLDERGRSWEDLLAIEPWMTESDAADMRRALARGRDVHATHRPT